MTAAEKANWRRAALFLLKASGVSGVILAVMAGMNGASLWQMLATAASGAVCSMIVIAMLSVVVFKAIEKWGDR